MHCNNVLSNRVHCKNVLSNRVHCNNVQPGAVKLVLCGHWNGCTRVKCIDIREDRDVREPISLHQAVLYSAIECIATMYSAIECIAVIWLDTRKGDNYTAVMMGCRLSWGAGYHLNW